MKYLVGLMAVCLFAQEPGPPPPQAGHPVLAIGSAAPDFSLPGVDGKTIR